MRRPRIVSFFMAIAAFAFVVGGSGETQARPFRPGLLPNGNVNSCSNCHVSRFGGGPRNPFGQEVANRVTPNGSQFFWGPDLAALDSDGDGVPNGVELGDPDGLWTQSDPDPGDPGAVTNPGDPEDSPPPPPPLQFRRGDVNADSLVNITDPIATLNFLFTGDGSPPACEKAADANADGLVNISDPTYTLNFLFVGAGNPPPPPFPDCGPEPDGSSTDLTCDVGECM